MEIKDLGPEDLIRLSQLHGKKQQHHAVEPEISDEELIKMTKQTVIGQNFEPKVFSPEDKKSNFWEIAGLPSKGRLYPEGTNLVGRPLKVLEVKKLASIGEQNGDFILNDILSKTVRGIDINEIFVADKLFIIFWLRANSFRDNNFTVNFNCPKCEKASDFHFNINDLETVEIQDEYDPNSNIKVGEDVIHYSYLKIKDEIYIQKFKEINSKILKDVDDEILAMAQMITSINGKEKTLMEKYSWMLGLDPQDYSYFQTYINKFGMGIKPYVNVTCSKCGGTSPIGITFSEQFMLPAYKAS